IVKKFNGKLIKTIGDALLVTFESPTNAVLCGLMMQEALWDHNKGKNEEDRIFVRVSINTGEVELKEGDVFGEAVNIASRLEGITEANEIYFTESVYLAMNKAEVPTSEVGMRILKGLPEPIKVYKVIQDRNSVDFQELITRIKTSEAVSGGRSSSKKPLIIGAFIIGLAAGYFLLADHPKKHVKAVDTAIAEGKLDLALNRADEGYQKYPGSELTIDAVRKVVKFEVQKLITEQKFDEARALLEQRQMELPKISFEQIERERLLDEGRWKYEHNSGWSRYPYERLVEKYPNDVPLLQEFVDKFGFGNKSGTSSSFINEVVLKLYEKTGKLDEQSARTLLEILKHYGPDNDTVKKVIPILCDKFPPVVDFARQNLGTMEIYLRYNSRDILKLKNSFGAAEEFLWHFYNLIGIDDDDLVQDFRAAVTFFRNYKPGPDWEDFKKNLGIVRIEDVRSCSKVFDASNEALDIVTTMFYPQAQAMLDEWAAGKYIWLRLEAYKVFEKKSELSRIGDFWKFHEWTLTRPNPKDAFSDFRELLQISINYFSGELNGSRAAEVRKIVKQSNEHFEELKDQNYSDRYLIKALKEITAEVNTLK
ncbi:MAG: adenylate/guanylate cyclase domain-containing protein, partial [Candidatus Wallbacteria bacterium]|nr:adenylate/guanylate cyclase domain-containing protein [Candidatus Wallbacteria bacterium]